MKTRSIELSDDTSLSEMNACNSADDVNLALECDDDDSLQTTQDGTDHGRHQACQGSGTKRGWRLQNEICTRWNSSLEMAESLLHMKSEVTNALKRIGKYDHIALQLMNGHCSMNWQTSCRLFAV